MSQTPVPWSSPTGKRRRVSKACDRCNRQRVKCDGKLPCSRCTNVHECRFSREAKKRGKIPRRTLQDLSDEPNGRDGLPDISLPDIQQRSKGVNESDGGRSISSEDSASLPNVPEQDLVSRGIELDQAKGFLQSGTLENSSTIRHNFAGDIRGEHLDLASTSETIAPSEELSLEAFLPRISVPSTETERPVNSRYPVLKPLLPYIRSFLTMSQTCGLLELYFNSAFRVSMHPTCRHIHAYLFRKSSVLSATDPRPCSPALLASMLWIAAETGGAEMLSWSHSKRRNVSRRLYILTIQLLNPLVHIDVGCARPSKATNGVEMDEPRTCDPRRNKFTDAHVEAFFDGPPFAETAGSLDDVVTYIHVAAIASASEHKAASMRWWHAAFTLARELKLNVESGSEVAESSASHAGNDSNTHGRSEVKSNEWFGMGTFDFDQERLDLMDQASDASNWLESGRSLALVNEERQEERRRVWWLLYIQDRHLALCYNRPLALLDAECGELLLPLDEGLWQAGSFLNNSSLDTPSSVDGSHEVLESTQRPVFPSFCCTGHSLFGFFLPLMTIAGEILDLNHARNHPLLGIHHRNASESGAFESEILRQLSCYENSLHVFDATYSRPEHSVEQRTNQDTLHTKTVVAYATHVTHVLHILLAGKWDPVSLFDAEHLWISSPSFTSTMTHAISAAQTVRQILEVDPDLSFMPYFLGIQLLQGSFVLLLIIDRLQTKTAPEIIEACEVIIRATEACVATLDTQYQRNYRQILCSAVVQARGRYVAQEEAMSRRRAVLALYRWTRSGTGLAL